MSGFYWYAPFDNAGEMSLAVAFAALGRGGLTVESCRDRFGNSLDTVASGRFRLVRDLPAPAGEGGTKRSAITRARVAIDRAVLRKRQIAAGGFDLAHLHTYNPITDWIAIPALYRDVRFVVLSVHNVRPHDSMFPRRVETWLLRRGYRACSLLVVAHEILASQLHEEFGIPESRIRIVPLPVQRSAFVNAGSSAERSGEVVRFLFFGTLRKNKGIERLLSAIEELRAFESLRFSFAGRGDADLESLVRAASERDTRIEAQIGFIDNDRRRDLYEAADVVLLPYTALDAQSGVLQDAYASSRPVIASDVGALGAAVRADDTGWLTRPGDVADLAATIAHVARAANERRDREQRSAQIARQRSPEEIAAQFSVLYDEVLAARRL